MRKLLQATLVVVSALACASCAGLFLYETSSAGRYPSGQPSGQTSSQGTGGEADECGEGSKECRSR